MSSQYALDAPEAIGTGTNGAQITPKAASETIWSLYYSHICTRPTRLSDFIQDNLRRNVPRDLLADGGVHCSQVSRQTVTPKSTVLAAMREGV
ncbi:hypothetical protein SARC_02798 [Sphaeroforma arctica JP610]|uniref:Uncharacterized protein n=1 Tax=Sphaeroforma arctica JP610 TaxID=667725 RepID=A0A0L0G7N7_9EUKA|nr:hypothetical protein SARC_02798 [Sphaeroforma arctica JP610]KNC85010.1 hypothetical protein SARC_02798 [Sphaeroforma arctica JP610]|eukprot:XP_014158912.1 hypothetical protein SARC_02798 [Sphaeroforma arctica JP610]